MSRGHPRVEVLESSDSDDESKPDSSVAETSQVSLATSDVLSTKLKSEGNVLFTSGNVMGALEKYEEALKFAKVKPFPPPPKDVHFNKGGEQANHEKESKPEVDVESTNNGSASPSATAEDLTDYTLTSQLFCNAGTCLIKLQRYEEAESKLSEAIRHNPAYEKAYLRRADCYYALGKHSSAHGDWETALTKFKSALDPATEAKRLESKQKTDEEMKKMMGQLKDLGNMFLGKFGLSTDNFKFDKDPNTGSYSMRFEK